jgi:P pilus assembly chaperone PapD
MSDGGATSVARGGRLARSFSEGRASHWRSWVLSTLVVLALLPATGRAQVEVENLEVVLRPDASGRVGLINVRNVGDVALSLSVTMKDWDRAEDGANRYHPLGSITGSCGSTLTVFPMSLRLEPNERQQLRVTLAEDASTEPCWSIIFISTPPMSRGDSSRVQMLFVSETGVKVYVEPSGLSRSIELDSILALPDTILDLNVPSERGAVQAILTATGRLQVRPRAVLQVRRPDNSIAASVPVPAFPVLPGATRRLTIPLPPLAPGPYVGLLLVDSGGPDVIAAQVAIEIPPGAP